MRELGTNGGIFIDLYLLLNMLDLCQGLRLETNVWWILLCLKIKLGLFLKKMKIKKISRFLKSQRISTTKHLSNGSFLISSNCWICETCSLSRVTNF